MGLTTHSQVDEYGGMWYRGDFYWIIGKLVANFDILNLEFIGNIYKQLYILAKCYVVDFKYQYDKAKIINTEPHSLGKTVVANQCSKVIYCTNTITNTHHT